MAAFNPAGIANSDDTPFRGSLNRGVGNLGTPADPYTGTLLPANWQGGLTGNQDTMPVSQQLANAQAATNRYQDWVAYNQAKDAAGDPWAKLALGLNLAGVSAGAGGLIGPAVSGAVGGGTAGTLAGGAAAGAATGVVGSGLTGQNVGKSTLLGAAGGAIGGELLGSGTSGAASDGTVSSSAAGDIALTNPTAGIATDAGSLAASDAASAGLGSVGVDAAGVAGGTAGTSSGMLDPITVTAPSTAGTGGGSALGDLAAPAAAGASSGMLDPITVSAPSTAGQPSDLLSGNGPLLASLGAVPGAMTDIGSTLNSGQPQFLSANDTQPSLQPMSSDLASQLGIDPSSITTDTSFDPSLANDNPGFGPMDIAGPTMSDSMQSWLSNPKNLATLGSLGISGLSAFSKPKLPQASQTASNNATALGKSALPIIQSGGTASPQWAGQKASIDASINQQIQQQSEALQQAAINSGMGNQNSGIVQQQIQTMKQNAEVQRQQLYQEAQQQNVRNAIAELSGSDAVLASIGNMELQQEERAQQIAAQTAELALRLYSSTGTPSPQSSG